MNSKIPGKELAKQLLQRFFISGIIRTIFNTLIPIFISLYSLNYSKKVDYVWYLPIIFMLFLIVVYNIIAEVLLNKERKELELIDLTEICYRNQCRINNESAIKLLRLNKLIKKHIDNCKPIDKIVFDKVADFESIAFDICNSIFEIIIKKFGIDTECEVTVFKSNGKEAMMVAFANEQGKAPAAYRRLYKIAKIKRKYLFIQLLRDLNAQIHCCVNKEEVERDFVYFEESKAREQNICQYIGIPFKTARRKIELLLQIDISKPNVFGTTQKEIIKVAKNIFYPYIVLLNKAYERDLIFNGYYDIIEKTLSNHESEHSNEG